MRRKICVQIQPKKTGPYGAAIAITRLLELGKNDDIRELFMYRGRDHVTFTFVARKTSLIIREIRTIEKILWKQAENGGMIAVREGSRGWDNYTMLYGKGGAYIKENT